MSHTAKSILPFGIYLLIIGGLFLFVPEVMLIFAGVKTPPDVMSRIFGMIIIFMGYYYIVAARQDEGMEKLFKATVYTRSSAIIFLTIFVFLSYANYLAIIFGLVDLAGALWTYFSLKKDNKEIE